MVRKNASKFQSAIDCLAKTNRIESNRISFNGVLEFHSVFEVLIEIYLSAGNQTPVCQLLCWELHGNKEASKVIELYISF